MTNIETKIVKIDPNNIDAEVIKQAAEIINAGGLVVFPTETVYGIGSDALNEKACEKIFAAKGRPQDNPLIVHISQTEALYTLAKNIPGDAIKLADKFWPGPLTMILEKKETISDIVSAKLPTVAIRYPKHKVALALIKTSQKPIAAPSANTSGKPSPTRAEHVVEDLLGKVDMIIDGGSCEIGLESTVLDMTTQIPTILRPGAITIEQIRDLLGRCEYDPAIIKSDEKVTPKSPGQKYRHYHPEATVILYMGNVEKIVQKINEDYDKLEKDGHRVGIISTSQTEKEYMGKNTICVGDREKLSIISSNLFKTLREFDKNKVDIILSESFEDEGLGRAIMNRLSKASNTIINV